MFFECLTESREHILVGSVPFEPFVSIHFVAVVVVVLVGFVFLFAGLRLSLLRFKL